jgi:hypothetical protein
MARRFVNQRGAVTLEKRTSGYGFASFPQIFSR